MPKSQAIAFFTAVVRGDLKMVEAMLQGKDPDYVNCRYPAANGDYMKTALHEASEQGHVAMVRALLRAGADVNTECVGWNKSTPLTVACYHCRSIEVVEELLKAGANVNHIDRYGQTPLLYLAHHDKGPMDECRLLIARRLLEAKCNVNYTTRRGESAISLAVDHQLHDLVLLLVEYGAIIPSNALYDCTRHKKVDTMAFLLEHG